MLIVLGFLDSFRTRFYRKNEIVNLLYKFRWLILTEKHRKINKFSKEQANRKKMKLKKVIFDNFS